MRNDAFTRTVKIVTLLIIFECSMYFITEAQGRVGIGTNHPAATLEIAGTLRVDTARTVTSTHRIAVLDSVGLVGSLDFDSLRRQGGTVGLLYQEVNAVATTTSNVAQPRVTLNLGPGTYIVFAYGEMYNTAIDAGVRAWLWEGATLLAYGIVYSNTSTYGSWSTMRVVIPTVTTTYTFSYASWPNNTPSFIRSARIIAVKIS